MEVWKDIIGFEDKYQVSNLGNVSSLKYNKQNKRKSLKPWAVGTGYLVVGLGRAKREYVHRLVAKAFIDNPNKYIEVNHLNGTKTDNRLENLEWCNRSHNQLHSLEIGLLKNRGEDSSNAKITKDDVLEIRRLYKEGTTQVEISHKFSLSKGQTSRIINKKRWAHI